MASRVNVKFVVLLVGSLVAVLAIAAVLFVTVLQKSGEDFVRMGDEQMAQGAYGQAVGSYGRAVAREQNNEEYLRKWIDAMEHYVPPTETVFRTDFQKYLAGKSALATALGTDVEAHEEYLGILWDIIQESNFSRSEVDNLATQTTQAVRYFSADEPGPDDEWATLLRYRGFARVRTMREGGDISREDIEQTRADLEAAIAADPDDREAVIGLGLFYAASAVMADRESRRTDQRAAIEAGLAVYDRYLESHPNDPFVRVERLLLTMDQIAMQVRDSGETVPANLRAMFEERYEPLREGFAEIAAAMRDSDETDHLSATRFATAEQRLYPAGQLALSRDILRSRLAANPKNAQLVMRLGQMQMNERLFEEAAETMGRVEEIGQEGLPLGLEGFLRFGAVRNATYIEARATIRLAGILRERIAQETDQEIRAQLEEQVTEHLARADAVQARFAALTVPEDPQMIRLNAERAYISRNYEQAQDLLRQYNERVGFQDAETLWWTGQTAVQMNQIGRAREAFQQARAAAPEQDYITVALGELEMRLNEHERALELFESVLANNPESEPAKTQAIQLRQLLGLVKSEDPARQMVLDAARIVRGTSAGPGDKVEAVDLLLDGLPRVNYDARVAREAARYLVDLDRLPQAARVLEQARERHPDDQELAALADILANPDPVVAKIALIERADLPRAEKTIAAYQLYRNAGRDEEAAGMLDQAIEAAPTDPLVIESAFLRAMNNQNWAEAQRWVAKAKETNADLVNGVTYESRLLFTRGEGNGGDRDRAVALLESITGTDVAPASAFTLLGRQRLAMGDASLAAQAFARSIEIMPNQPSTLLEYLQALVRSNQYDRALLEARRLQRQGSGSSDFVNAWLDLEARYGDKSLALERREERQLRDPSDRANREALAKLYIDTRRWQAGEALILGLREESDSLELVRLHAEWYAAQGNADGARGVYADYITSLDPATEREAFVRAHLNFAQFLSARRAYSEAVAAIQQIRSYQDTQSMSADRLLAEIYQQGGQIENALVIQQGIVAAGADDEDKQYQKRAIDSMIRLGRLDEASETLNRAAGSETRDPVFLVQRAEIEKQKKNYAAARRALDQAISIDPQSALGYIKRAELLLQEYVTTNDDARRGSMVNDALADLDEAVRLSPDSWIARQLRAQTFFTVGRIDEAVAEFRSALQLQPDQDALRQRLMIELIGLQRYDDAVFLATDAINKRPGDLGLIVSMSKVFSDRGLWERSASIVKLGWETARSTTFGALYCDALLNTTPPRVNEARDVLGALRDSGADVNGSAGLLVLQGVILAKSNRTADAIEMMIRAYAACDPANPNQFSVWYANLPRVFPDRPGEHVRLIENAIQRVGATTPSGEWGNLLLTQALMNYEPRRAEGLSRLRALAENTDIPGRSIQSWLELGGAYLESDPEAAVAVWREGLALHPESWQLLNNTAYTLAKRLDRPDEALPIATEASEIAIEEAAANPNISAADAIDTLGLAHYLLGMKDRGSSAGDEHLEEAERLFTQAGEQASTLSTAATVLYHQTIVAFARGDREQTQIRGERFVRQIEAAPSLRKSFEEELSEIKSVLGRS